jgi:hypothetical protein
VSVTAKTLNPQYNNTSPEIYELYSIDNFSNKTIVQQFKDICDCSGAIKTLSPLSGTVNTEGILIMFKTVDFFFAGPLVGFVWKLRNH